MLRLVRSWQDLGKILTSVPCGNACQDHGKILSRSWQANDMKISSSEKLKKTCLTQSSCSYNENLGMLCKMHEKILVGLARWIEKSWYAWQDTWKSLVRYMENLGTLGKTHGQPCHDLA